MNRDDRCWDDVQYHNCDCSTPTYDEIVTAHFADQLAQVDSLADLGWVIGE